MTMAFYLLAASALISTALACAPGGHQRIFISLASLIGACAVMQWMIETDNYPFHPMEGASHGPQFSSPGRASGTAN